jgi:hypothetical protein
MARYAAKYKDREVEGVILRTCNTCGKEGPLSSSYAWKNKAKDQRHTKCKECFSRLMRERISGPGGDALRAQRRSYHHANKEKRNAQRRGNYDPRRTRDAHLRAKYGISIEEYEAMLEAQGGVCAVCGKAESVVKTKAGTVSELAVDHNHATGRVRGLLCNKCNLAVGHLETHGDHAALIAYLTQHLNLAESSAPSVL